MQTCCSDPVTCGVLHVVPLASTVLPYYLAIVSSVYVVLEPCIIMLKVGTAVWPDLYGSGLR